MVEFIDVCFEQNIIGLSKLDLVNLLISQFKYAKDLNIEVVNILPNYTIEYKVEGNNELVEKLICDLD